MLTKIQMAIAAALVLASASAASAQSYDPDIGTGNLVPYAAQSRVLYNQVRPRGVDAYARVTPGALHSGMTADEKALFDRIRPE